MEPTIYKPSIYKGAGIYKTGTEGGGGGGGISDKNVYSVFFANSFNYINLNNSFLKTNLSIKTVFATSIVGRNSNIIEFLNNNNITAFLAKTSGGNLRVSNSSDGGDDSALGDTVYSVVMKGINYRKMWVGATSNYTTAFIDDSINRIGIGANVEICRITLFEGNMEIDDTSNILLDLRPSKQEGANGFKDIVTGDFYQINHSQVF